MRAAAGGYQHSTTTHSSNRLGSPLALRSLTRRALAPAAPSSSSMAPLDQPADKPKLIRLMRHGTTFMNEYLRKFKHEGNDPAFKDPVMVDTLLTPGGIEGAKAAKAIAQSLEPVPELLVVSPLTRALQTASYAWLPWLPEDTQIIVEPLARERVWLAADTGRSPAELKVDFPDGRFNFDAIPEVWWWAGDGNFFASAVQMEPEEVFNARVSKLYDWLAARPESTIAVVAHWGLLHQLTGGVDFANCELRSFHLSPGKRGLVPVDSAPTQKVQVGVTTMA